MCDLHNFVSLKVHILLYICLNYICDLNCIFYCASFIDSCDVLCRTFSHDTLLALVNIKVNLEKKLKNQYFSVDFFLLSMKPLPEFLKIEL